MAVAQMAKIFGQEERQLLLLSISTIICFLTLFGFGLYQGANEKDDQYNGNDKGRNERSTPRSFILPATPAVALRQEYKRAKEANKFQIKYCVLKLYDLGYEIMDFNDIFDIRTFIGLINFQREKGLTRSGEFDPATITELGCQL